MTQRERIFSPSTPLVKVNNLLHEKNKDTGGKNIIYYIFPQLKYADTRVSDPHLFNADPDTDPDPAFFLIAGSGSRV